MSFLLPPNGDAGITGQLSSVALPVLTLSDRVAVGIRSYPHKSATTWFVMDIAKGAVTSVAVKELEKSASVEAECSAIIGISALLATWCSTADEGISGLLSRVADLNFFVVGDASAFIRNLASVVELMMQAAKAIRAQAVVS